MANFNQKITPVTAVSANFDFPSANTSLAGLIKDLGGLAIENRVGNVKKDLVGRDPNAEYSKEDLMKAALDNKELNLRKIKQMREQGLVTASGAKIMANQAVQAASARLPGRAAEFRQQAAVFFGDFGEGQDLLKQTADEGKQAELVFALKKAAALKGYGRLDPKTGQLVQSSDQVNDYLDVVNKAYQNERESQAIELNLKRGTATTADAVTLANRRSRTFLLGFLGDVNGKLTQDGVLFKPEELNARLLVAQQGAEAAVDKFMNDPNNAGTITPQMRTAARNEIAATFTNMKKFVESQSFAKVMQERRQGVQDLTKIYSYNALPEMALAYEAGGDNAVKFFTEYAPKFQHMNANQRAALLRNDPLARNAWNTAIAADRIRRSYGNVLRGFLPGTDSAMDRAVTQDGAAWTMTQPAANPGDQETKSHAFDILRQSANEGQREKLKVLEFPETAKNSTPQDQEKVLNLLSDEWAGHLVHTSNLLTPKDGIKADQDIVYDPSRGQYRLVWTKRGEEKYLPVGQRIKVGGKEYLEAAPSGMLGQAGLNSELVRSVEAMNTDLRIMRNFSGTDAFRKEFRGQSIDQFAEQKLSQVQMPRNKAIKATEVPLTQEQVDNLLIDVRMGGSQGEAARRMLKSKGVDADAAMKANEEAAKKAQETQNASK
jgi:hypothetical protein